MIEQVAIGSDALLDYMYLPNELKLGLCLLGKHLGGINLVILTIVGAAFYMQ